MELIYRLIRLFKQKNEGFDSRLEQKKIKKEGDHYFQGDGQLDARLGALGGLEWKVIKPNGNWEEEAKKVIFESQIKGTETMFCTVFGTENAIQMMQQARYGAYEEYDEIPLANLAGVSPYKGGSPHNVAEAIRRYGMFPAGTYPFTDQTTREQLTMTPTSQMVANAAKWKERWNFGHEWLSNFTPSGMMESLKYSPLGIGVYAWQEVNGFYPKPSWATDNHWTALVVGYKENEYWLVCDSYKDGTGTQFKKLPWNYQFKFAKRYFIEKKTLTQAEQTQIGKSLYERLIGKHIIRSQANGEVYEVTDNMIKFCFWTTDCSWLQDQLNKGLREEEGKGNFVGISEVDFANLKTYAILAGIVVESPNKIK